MTSLRLSGADAGPRTVPISYVTASLCLAMRSTARVCGVLACVARARGAGGADA